MNPCERPPSKFPVAREARSASNRSALFQRRKSLGLSGSVGDLAGSDRGQGRAPVVG